MNINRRSAIEKLGIALVAMAGHAPVFAETYPSRPVRIIVPYAPGGTTDAVARLVAQSLTYELKQTVIVENRPGAGTAIAARSVAHAKPDGYTFLMATNATNGFNPAVNKAIGYDPVNDFTPVSPLGSLTGGVMVNPSFPAKDFAGFVKVLKESPGKYSYASSGVGSGNNFCMELLKEKIGVSIMHIPYSGGGPAQQAVLGGIVPMMWDSMPTNINNIKTGRLVCIGVASRARIPLLPEIPTFTELGVKDYVIELWNGIIGPAELPPIVVATMSAAIHRAMKHPELLRKLRNIGTEILVLSPSEFTEFIRLDSGRWKRVAKMANITIN